MAKILVIDDDQQLRKMLVRILKSNGYDVRQAGNGEEGMKLLCEDVPELVITDIVMPDKEGLETISDIRRQFPQVKIIAMSGGGHSIDAANPLFIAGKIGASHTLTKPFEIEKILDVVAGMV
ncbi:MAG: response regulator [Calditrichaeota bacterium]|nr:response regulator [Calditrichota bacterium]HQU73156.1 response regulator [Calditrichia bacterium]